jgi:hypothetical protein
MSMIALPLAVNSDEKLDVLVVPKAAIQGFNVTWDHGDQAFELSVLIDGEQQEITLGVNDLMVQMGWDNIEDPSGTLQNILDLEAAG